MFFGSTLDIFAWDFYSLIAGRVMQAVSAGITMPMMMSEIMTSFPRDKQATVMGIAGIAMGFAPNIGPTIGGWMIGVAAGEAFSLHFQLLRYCWLLLRCCHKKCAAINRRQSLKHLLLFFQL